MIDATSIASTVFEEIRLYVSSCFEDRPISDKERLALFTEVEPLPPERVLPKAIEESFWASLLTEEGRYCRLRLTYCDSNFQPQENLAHRLRTPLALTRDNLRRLSHAHDYKCGEILWQVLDDEPRIVGIRIPLYKGRSLGLRIRAKSPGYLDVSWGGQQLLIRNRENVVRYSCIDLNTYASMRGLMEIAFGDGVGPHRLLPPLIAKIREQGHGGSLWVLPEGNASQTNLTINYEISNSMSIMAVQDEQEQIQWLDSLARFAGVDGAVLVDTSLRALAFGVFVDVKGEHEAARIVPGGMTETVRGDEIGGGRHRAAVAFCNHTSPAFAVVVSQDGRVTVVAKSRQLIAPLLTEMLPMGLRDLSHA